MTIQVLFGRNVSMEKCSGVATPKTRHGILHSKGKQRIAWLFLWLTLVMIFPPDLVAQPIVTQTRPLSRAAQYYIGEEGELLIKVNIWGRVRQPGQYFVPSNTDLITLISVAGGPAEKSRLDNVRVVRNTKAGSEIILVNIKKYLY